MLQNESLYEELENDIQSKDENQEEENLEIESEETEESEESQIAPEPKKKNLVQTLREEIKELKKAQKTVSLDADLETRLFFIEHPELKEDRELILATKSEHPSLTYEQAHILGKSQKPKESTSKKESFKG